MDLNLFFTICAAIFIAEFGVKTQLVTMLFATYKGAGKFTIFLSASSALILASAIAVLAESFLLHYISERRLHMSPELFLQVSASGCWSRLR